MEETNHQLRIGNYTLGRTIGRGTFAKVKEGTHILTSQTVAIKILDKTKIEDDDDKQRILRQLEILRKVRHPNIIQLYEIFETQEEIYIINEFAEKGELFRLINQQYKLQEKTSARIFLQVLNALEYLHRLGISHRDLKPENILLDFDYNVKLVDFGLSNYFKKGDLLNTACGSPCYAPPEMVAGKAYDGFISDVWSLGIIFFVMICGYLPFEEKTTKDLYAKIIEGKYELPKNISAESKQVIQKMLNCNPEVRISLSRVRSLGFFKPYLEMQPVIFGIILGVHPMPIDMELLKLQSKHLPNMNSRKAEEMIRSNKHNEVTSTYYLLQKKILREGGKTNIDLQIYLESSKEYRKDYGQSVMDQVKSRSIESVTNYERHHRSLKRKIILNKKTNKMDSVTKKKNVSRLKSEAPTSLEKSTIKKRPRLSTLTEEMQRTLIISRDPQKCKKSTKMWNAYVNNNLKLSQTARVNVKDRQKQRLHEGNISKIKDKTKLPELSAPKTEPLQHSRSLTKFQAEDK